MSTPINYTSLLDRLGCKLGFVPRDNSLRERYRVLRNLSIAPAVLTSLPVAGDYLSRLFTDKTGFPQLTVRLTENQTLYEGSNSIVFLPFIILFAIGAGYYHLKSMKSKDEFSS